MAQEKEVIYKRLHRPSDIGKTDVDDTDIVSQHLEKMCKMGIPECGCSRKEGLGKRLTRNFGGEIQNV